MNTSFGWGHDMIPQDSIALESLIPIELDQGKSGSTEGDFFKPVNITVEQGVFYITIYVCYLEMNPSLMEGFKIFLSSLKKTDRIKLSVSSTLTGIPFIRLTEVLTAVGNTDAHVTIFLDQIVMDGLAYFYLLADKIDVRTGGALFIPSYVDQRAEDMSKPWKAAHDFYEWIIDDALRLGRITNEEAKRLTSGSHVVIPTDRFSK